MATIPITSLSPSEAPPASKSIRAVVSLLWPYSSSTKQCALLLADPDFRLRHRKGQVRVRFTGASAQAVANGRIGIGDELLLELGGAQWAVEQAHVNTPGKSVDGELVYGGQLGLSVTTKANGEQSDLKLQVNESTPPPEERERPISNGDYATPARAASLWMRSSMGGADVTPIYSSPAFVKRSRLSGDKTSWDPFVDLDRELEDETGSRKRQRISFGGVRRWKLSGRTPSPEKETPRSAEFDAQARRATSVTNLGPTSSKQSQVLPIESTLEQGPGIPTMPPPPLPRLQLPTEPQFTEQVKASMASEDNGPSTPKLHPVPSSALPLPSPFPTDAPQVHFDIASQSSAARATAMGALIEAADTAKEVEASAYDGTQPEETSAEETSAEEMSPVVTSRLLPPSTGLKGHAAPVISPSASLASTVEGVREEDQSGDTPDTATNNRQQSLPRDVQHAHQAQEPIPEYLSDTEEDEEMYYDHMRRRFPSVTESGRVRVDHQEEGYYDDISQVHEDDVEEVIEADDMGEEPGSEESDVEESEDVEDVEESLNEAAADVQETPQPPVIDVETMRDARVELRNEDQETLETPARPPPGVFGFDGAANDTPFQPKSTPQSDKDKVMKKTYSSLFGFKASPSPELPRQQQVQTPTPGMPIGHLSQLAKERLDAFDAPTKRVNEPINAEEVSQIEPKHERRSKAPSPPVLDLAGSSVTAAESIEDAADSMTVGDIHDGSLLAAVRTDNAKQDVTMPTRTEEILKEVPDVEETIQASETPVIPETPQIDIEMQVIDNDPVPDGVSINQKLGEAIVPEIERESSRPPSSSAPIPTQVIDLGDSSDDDEQPGPAPQQDVHEASEQELRPELQLSVPPVADLAQREVRPLTQLTREPPSQNASRHVTQDSQGSALQSDMLDTTQTTVDRSEIMTPVVEEFDAVIPDASQEDALWLNQGQQDGFFAGEMANQEFEGAAVPQLTQQATATVDDPYRYFSFQSATSVATDNSDNLPPTAVQSFAQGPEVEPVPETLQEEMVQQEVVASQQSNTLQLDPALALPDTIEETPQDDAATEPDDMPVDELEQPESKRSLPTTIGVDDVETGSFSQRAQRPGSAEIHSGLEQRLSEEIAGEHEPPDVAAEAIVEASDNEVEEDSQDVGRQTLALSDQASYPVLPISPEESQHRLESQELETQLPYPSVSHELPPTPQLTQGDSLTQNEMQVRVEEADHEADQDPDGEAESARPSTAPRTRRSQKAAQETLASPAKKTPIRRSARVAQAESEESLNAELQEERQLRSLSSQGRPKSVQSESSQTLLVPAKKTAVRRSPRKAQGDTETLEELTEHEAEDASEAAASQTSPRQPSSTSLEKTPIRRSSRKPHAESQTSDKATDGMEATPQTKPSTRQSTRTEDLQTAANGTIAVAEPRKENEEIDDTISVTPPTKPKTRQQRQVEAQKKDDEDSEMADAQLAVPPKTPTGSRKSFTSQLGRVPAVISNWFSPRRSSRYEIEHEEGEPAVEQHAGLKREKSNGFHTALSYFTPLSNLEEKVNPASQYQAGNTVDVLAVVTNETKAPERAKGGPRDYYTIFQITDSSTPDVTARAEVFRPWHSTLPKAQVGDVVLLRAFAVKTRKRKPYLLSTDASAWCVWRYTEGVDDKPATRRRGASFSATSGAREEIKGPPVEFGDEERERAAKLRKWWLDNKKEDGEENVQASPKSVRTTRSQKL